MDQSIVLACPRPVCVSSLYIVVVCCLLSVVVPIAISVPLGWLAPCRCRLPACSFVRSFNRPFLSSFVSLFVAIEPHDRLLLVLDQVEYQCTCRANDGDPNH